MKSANYFIGMAMILLIAGCFFKSRPELVPAPVLLPGTLPEMNTPGYWIARHPFPDSLLMTSGKIEEQINRPIREKLKAVRDLAEYPARIGGVALREDLEDDIASFERNKTYDDRGRRISKTFFADLRREMNLISIPEAIPVRFAMTVGMVNLRQLPTSTGVFEHPGEFDFDALQNSSYDLGTPLAIVLSSQSGRWRYVITPYNKGWVEIDNIAFCERGDITDPTDFVINLRAKSDLYLDSGLTRLVSTVQMGTRLPLLSEHDGVVEVRIPQRSVTGGCYFVSAYMRAVDMHRGYLPYTPRNVIEQAFEMLNAPYGWSGMFGEQDCSRFLQQTFACFGVQLPRKSTLQGKTGIALATFEKGTSSREKAALLEQKAVAGITILQMPGHVVLYLGQAEGKPYAIHATWSYREREGRVEKVRVINRVVVSDLYLGQYSKRGSLLFRTRNVRLIAGN